MQHLSGIALIYKKLLAQGLTCIRGDRVLFRNVGFTLENGSLIYVLGENGSGKSSLLRILSGLLIPESGELFWDGKLIKPGDENYHSDLLYIGHLNGLKDDLTAAENLLMSARLSGYKVTAQTVLNALREIGVGRCSNLPVRVLSQGQKRRVALARLWLTESPLWILDEPFAALDATSVDVLVTRLNQHMVNGGMAIITTHQDVVINAQFTQNLRLDS